MFLIFQIYSLDNEDTAAEPGGEEGFILDTGRGEGGATQPGEKVTT